MEQTTNQYFTFVNQVIGPYTYNPKYAFDNVFEGMSITYVHICSGNGDSRQLGKWTYVGEIAPDEIRNIVNERLSMYGYHEKTEDKALEFATSCGVQLE